jgi:hypothetical protein
VTLEAARIGDEFDGLAANRRSNSGTRWALPSTPQPLDWRERWPPLTGVEATAHVLAGLPLVVVVAAVATVVVVVVVVPVVVIMIAVMVVVVITAKEATSEDVRD